MSWILDIVLTLSSAYKSRGNYIPVTSLHIFGNRSSVSHLFQITLVIYSINQTGI